MKIAQIVSTFAPRLGGMGMVCAQEARALVRAGHSVTVFTLQYDDARDYTEHDKQFPFKIVRLKPLFRLGDAGLVPGVAGQISKNFDLVHLHYPFYGAAEWLAFVKIPLVITYHMDAQVNGLKLIIATIYNLIWPRFLFAKAKKIITVDKKLSRSNSLVAIRPDKIMEINNGVDVAIFKPQPPEFKKLDLADIQDKRIVLFVGNLLPLKRLDLLIRAVAFLQDKNIVLVVVGAGKQMAACARMVKKLRLESQVRFVGSCHDQNTLARYYNLAACVVVPSDYESFSLVAAEAMACGKPIVLSDLPEFKERFTQAIFFKKGSVESLAKSVAAVLSLSSAETRKVSEWGRLKVIHDFSLDTHMKKLENVYRTVISD